MKFFVFAASHRPKSLNRSLILAASAIAKAQNVEIEYVDYDTLDAPIFNADKHTNTSFPEQISRMINAITQADGMIIAAPEYNWSLPGSLKNLIDWISIARPVPLEGKTALLLSASPSLRGGTLGLQALRIPLEALGTYVFPRLFTLSRANDAFDEHGTLKDSKLQKELTKLIHDFVYYAQSLKAK